MTSVVLMGTPQFAVPILEAIIQHGYEVLAVVTQPDREVGRHHKKAQSPVKQAALTNNLTVLQPEKLSGSPEMQQLLRLAPDLIITAAYGQFLPTKLLKAAKIAAINVHGSLLPKYRGGAPIQYSILKGDAKTGVTVMYMAKRMDAGDIIAQAELPIQATDDSGTLFEKLSLVGRDLLIKTLPAIVQQTAPRTPQDEAEVTFAYNIQPAEEQINIQQSAKLIDQQVRALRPEPGAYLYLGGQHVKIWQLEVLTEPTTAAPGTLILKTKKRLVVAAGENSAFAIENLQPAGKASMPIQAYLNGAGQKLVVGTIVITGEMNDKK